MNQQGFFFNSNRCTGCKACQVACKETYKLPTDTLWRKVYEYQGGQWVLGDSGNYEPQGVFGYFVSMSCNHCDQPACYAACASGAIDKDDETGLVIIDEDKCIGCRNCETACPYDAPSFNEETGKMTKCDGCYDRVINGERPVCVAGCTMRVLDFGDIDEMKAQHGVTDCNYAPLPAATTSPNYVMNPHRNAEASGEGTGSIMNLQEEL